ncbi:MAG: hypothetical protein ACI9U1_001674, partial [Porticoccaceae bacterium]
LCSLLYLWYNPSSDPDLARFSRLPYFYGLATKLENIVMSTQGYARITLGH